MFRLSFGKGLGVVATLLCLALLSSNGSVEASFRVSEDSFSISNSPGYCFAMAAFARWYYLVHQGEPPLRKVIDKKAQQLIARELQTFYSRNMITLQAEYCNRYYGNQSESFKRFAEGLVKDEPRIVLLMNKGPKGAVLHAVLAYEYNAEQNIVKVYDPNYMSEERVIDLDHKQYVSLDVTYNAICFPEVLHHHTGLIRKMESLYARHFEHKAPATMVSWRGAATSPSGKRLKSETDSSGPAKH